MNTLMKALFATLLGVNVAAVQATPMEIDFTLASSTGGTLIGSGAAFADSANLVPGNLTMDPTQLTAITLSMAGIPGGGPTTTTFTKADLNDIEWVLSVDGSGTIIDLNFFMRGGGTNADGYSIEGFGPFKGHLCAGTATTNACIPLPPLLVDTTLDDYVITVTSVHIAVPEPASLALLGIGLLGLRLGRRKSS